MRRKASILALAGLLATASPVVMSAQTSAPPVNGTSSSSSAASAVPNGTRFLVRLEDSLSSKKHKVGKKFKAKTLDPLEARDGSVVAPGAEVRGHVSRVEPARVTGRARLWLSFDEIKTRGGWLPVVANVTSVPGEHSVRSGESKEGEIEARTSKGTRELEAAAAGAAIGAVVGAASKGGKGAALGAALGGAAGFLIATGMGQELELQKGTKLELELERPLYLAKY